MRVRLHSGHSLAAATIKEQRQGRAGRHSVAHVLAGAAGRPAVVWVEVAVPGLILLDLMPRGQLAPLVAVWVLALRPVLLHDDRQHRLVPRHGGWRQRRRREVAVGRLRALTISLPTPALPAARQSRCWGAVGPVLAAGDGDLIGKVCWVGSPVWAPPQCTGCAVWPLWPINMRTDSKC